MVLPLFDHSKDDHGCEPFRVAPPVRVEVGPVERLLELTPVNTLREGVVTPLGRYFDVHDYPCEESDHCRAGGRL